MPKRKNLGIEKKKEIKKIEEIKIETNEFTRHTSIKIIFSNEEINNLWRNSVAVRIHEYNYSQEQLKEILEGSKSFLKSIDKIPQIFNEIIEELEEAIRKH